MSALNWMKVRELREAYGGGETQGSLSKRFGVSVITIGRIVRGESWQEKGGGGAVVRGAGGFVPPVMTMEELDRSAQRMLELQKTLGRKAPLSPMEGGEYPGDGGGDDQPPSGLAKLAQVALVLKETGNA